MEIIPLINQQPRLKVIVYMDKVCKRFLRLDRDRQVISWKISSDYRFDCTCNSHQNYSLRIAASPFQVVHLTSKKQLDQYKDGSERREKLLLQLADIGCGLEWRGTIRAEPRCR